MTRPPYGQGPISPGGRPVPPPPGRRPGAPGPRPEPGYPQRPGPGYPQRQGYPPPPGYQPHPGPGGPQASPYGIPLSPPLPPVGYTPHQRPPTQPPAPRGPTPYGPTARPTPPPRRRRWGTVLLIVIVVVTGVLLRTALSAGVDKLGAGDSVDTGYGPDIGALGVAETAGNPLLTDTDATLVPADCDYAPWSTQVEQARAFFDSAATCLESGWRAVFAEVGLSFEAPKVTVTASTTGITTLCTGNSSNFAAFYCSADKTIYMPISQLQTDVFKNNWVVYLSVFAHEYGHHVQAQSGILGKVHAQRREAGVRSDTGLELSRRTELQANCFDGMYLSSSRDGGALTSAQIGVARNDAYHRGDAPGDMRDHGTTQNGGAWFELGLDENRTFACNTFTAPASAVN
ncbi:neutral zinc metallopeptidase [Nocardia otitidiscaviarum]|nr:neutral zinc metallopeptidase [Nocardia otitidiscaviarum]